jgi:hypothetical protein
MFDALDFKIVSSVDWTLNIHPNTHNAITPQYTWYIIENFNPQIFKMINFLVLPWNSLFYSTIFFLSS